MHTTETLGINDGTHNVEGIAKIIAFDDGTYVLRLENFKAIDGPILQVKPPRPATQK